jgi:pimeloyl-ACP methyl ester carboxylesterase
MHLLTNAPSITRTEIDFSQSGGQSENIATQKQVAFDWESIIPSRDLRYVPCNGGYQCARLLLPMDWTASSERQWDHTVAIALMKLPANITTATDARYGGELYLNPGGPGASGVAALQRLGGYIGQTVNTESKVFDLVGFDPRGIIHSTPRFSCFGDGNVQGRDLFALTEGIYGWSESALPRVWARAEAFIKMCDPTNQTTDEAVLKSHMSTASVARDLLEIIERAGEARAAKVVKELALMNENVEILDPDHLQTLKYQPGHEKLQYWGFSYGTDLGGHFASMFPDRVGRMVLDGNGDFPDYLSGRWMSFLNNTDASFGTLFTTCFAAGKGKCPLFRSSGPEAIEEDVMSILDELKANPLPIWEEGMKHPVILTYENVIETIFTATYKPYANFPLLAEALAAMKDPDNLNISSVRYLIPDQGIRCSDKSCTSVDCAGEDGAWYHEPNVAVSCSDTAVTQPHRSFADFKAWAGSLHQQSKFFGGFFTSDSTMACHKWPTPPSFRFEGTFGGRTNHPILFVGNTLDPISPVENTWEMAHLFDGAVALITNAGGHCSPAAPSLCTAMHIRRYMQTGELPNPGTVCELDYPVFGEPAQQLDMDDQQSSLLKAIQEIAESRDITARRFMPLQQT